MIEFVVYGTPAPQGSKRHVGHGRMVEQNAARIGPWRDAVRSDAAMAHGDAVALDGELFVDMVFSFARPRSHYRTGRNAHLLREAAPGRPAGPPDLSKLARSTEDALKDAGVIVDDARIVEYGRLAKVYVDSDRDALNKPGAVIRVRPIGGAP